MSKDKFYIDDTNIPPLPLFDEGKTRNEQAREIGKFASEVVAEFDGHQYSKEKDRVRLTSQIKGVHDCINLGEWQTVEEISSKTGYPQASISAQLRNLRKPKFGGLNVEGRYRAGTRIFEYRLEN